MPSALRRLLLLAALCCAALPLRVQPLHAQKLPQDPRPLEAPAASSVPAYSSLDALRQTLAAAPTALRDRATPVGAGDPVRWTLDAHRLAQRAAGKSGTGTDLHLQRAPNGTVRWMRGPLGRGPGGAGKAAPAAYAEAAAAALDAYGSLLRLDDPAGELRPLATETDALGYVHARFEQVYAGLPVWGRDLAAHFDAAGELYLIHGTYEPTPSIPTTTPTLTAEAAVDVVTSDLRARGHWAPLAPDAAALLGMEAPSSQLVLYPVDGGAVRLAHEVTLHPNLVEHFTYLVDAQTGAVLNRIAQHCSVHPDDDASPVDAPTLAPSIHPAPAAARGAANGFLDATGVDLMGRSQPLRVFRDGDGLHALIWDLDNLPADWQLPIPAVGGILTLTANGTDLDENGQLGHVTTGDNVWADPSSVSAHANAYVVYNYFRQAFGRKAIDGLDQSILSVVHVTRGGQPMDNAFWNGRAMAYGDGADVFTPLAGALDVAAHEMSHGVVMHTAGLIYQFQSGALNESFADVFGVMVDREDFLLGEDIMRAHAGLRDIAQPGNPQVLSQQPAHMREYQDLGPDQDNGGVHINSGIPNRAAALVIQAIGHDRTQQIYYRALSQYLTRNSTFIDARNALEQAATDLFGAGAELAAVRAAYDAVGITTGSGNPDDGGGDDVDPIAGGSSLITFMTESGDIGVLDLTDPSNPTARLFGGEAVARVSGDDFAQLSVGRSGERIWFVNPSGQLAFVTVETGEVSYFPDLHLEQPGDLWNASIAPDESFVALVSSYADDPTLYFSDGTEVGSIELKPEGTQPGVQRETIQYPDVVSWSPNARAPKVAFDALNELALGAISYWGIYELDFGTGKIFDLVPSPPEGLSLGNITYSSTDPDLVAFNVFDDEGTWDVLLANFTTGEAVALELPSYTADGEPVIDGTRPTFSPADDALAVASASTGRIFVYDFASGGLGWVTLGEAVYNPRWFVYGGRDTTPVEDDGEVLPSTVVLETPYPNPFNPRTTLRYALAASGPVSLRVYDALGRAVATLVDGTVSAGVHEVSFDAAGLASGVYLARIEAGGATEVQRLVLMK